MANPKIDIYVHRSHLAHIASVGQQVIDGKAHIYCGMTQWSKTLKQARKAYSKNMHIPEEYIKVSFHNE